MRINELLNIQSIDLDAQVSTKLEAIDHMTKLMEKGGNLKNREDYKKGVLAREEEGTTGIGDGVAIPHSKCAAVKKAGLSAMVVKNGVDYDALDGQPVQLLFMIAAPEGNVDLARFDGKPVIVTKVADGIHKADELIEKAISGTVAIHHHTGAVEAGEESEEKESIGRQIYKHLMNGVSHMLPILSGYIAMSIADRPGLAVGIVSGLVAKAGMTFANPAGGDVNAGFLGAIFAGFAAGYVILGLKKLTAKIPQSLNSVRPMIIYPVFGVLIGSVVTTVINPFMGMINTALSNGLNSLSGTSKILLGVICAGMQSVDMGGPVNKTSYVFATSQLAEGNFEIMAAVMAGGMIPPLAIALCTTFFKNRFTKKERESGLVNYLLGLSFISEGAIPFAASDPIRVLPSCIVGSAVAGGYRL